MNKRRRGRPSGVGLKLTQEKASEIKRRYYTTQTSLRRLGREFGVSHQTVFMIVTGAMWVRQ